MFEGLNNSRTFGLVRGGVGSVVTATLLWGVPAGLAQPEIPSVELKWVARERSPSINAPDQAKDTAFWQDPSTGERWVFSTGYITDGTGHRRFATYKYTANWPEEGLQLKDQEEFYPPEGTETDRHHQAVAIAVDGDGNVYVTGFGQRPFVNDYDYMTIKYNKLLEPQWTGTVRAYDFANLDDKANDIMVFDDGSVAVTGTSPGGETGTLDDIATVLYDSDGNLSSLWPVLAEPGAGVQGVRRYDAVSLPDTGVELVGYTADVPEIGYANYVFVGGTSNGGGTSHDFVTLKYGVGGSLATLNYGWIARFNSSGSNPDHAAGIAIRGALFVVVTGRSPHPPGNSSAGGMALSSPTSINWDYNTIVYNEGDGSVAFQDYEEWSGYDDYANDVQWATDGTDEYVWVTGKAGTGPLYDFGTIVYKLTGSTWSNPWRSTFGPVSGRDDVAMNIAIHGSDAYVTGLTAAYSGTNYDALTLKYLKSPSPPNYLPVWGIYFAGGSGGHDAGLAITVGNQSPKPSVYVAGESFESGYHQDFVTLRYKQNP